MGMVLEQNKMEEPKKRVFDESQGEWLVCGMIVMIAGIAILLLWHTENEKYQWIPGLIMFLGSWYGIAKGIFPK